MSRLKRDVEWRSRARAGAGGCICALPGAGGTAAPHLFRRAIQLNVHALLPSANADKLLLDLQQAAVYFQRQKQVLQGVSSQLLLDRLIWRFTPAGWGRGHRCD